ncbi:hypothetical protein F4806DRAFT_444087, partial [Annulohypoxylon nitens]
MSIVRSRPDSIRVESDFGLLNLRGWIHTLTLAVQIDVIVAGICLGTYNFNLKDGFVVKFDLLVASGRLHFYKKNSRDLWIRGYCDDTRINSSLL